MSKKQEINIFWFRRDLRLHDNHALFRALQKGNVLPIFIFDPEITDNLQDQYDRRINFIYDELVRINAEIKNFGSTITTFYNKPTEVFKILIKQYTILGLYYNADYEPFAIERDYKIKEFLENQNIDTYAFKDQVIFEQSEILKNDGKPYTVFTPYAKKWKTHFNKSDISAFPSEELLKQFLKTDHKPVITPDQFGFKQKKYNFPDRKIDSDIIINYHKTRDYPAIHGTSRLSVHLRFGTISIREVVKTAYKLNETFLNELIWREFYMMILWHFPHVVDTSFKKKYDHLEWNRNNEDFEAWCKGQTGYPIVDAGMRELNQTGFMHNRLRMITASFLTKHLLIDWRWGEAYFAEKLLDYELSSNNGGWQWAASTGCDAVPYFRIFNPELQAKKYDRNDEYIKKWIPELNTEIYPKPMVDHHSARNRALSAYKKIQSL